MRTLGGGPALSDVYDAEALERVLLRAPPSASAITPVIVLVQDLDIRVVAATTGELLRELTLTLSRDCQPQEPRNPWPHETKRGFRGFLAPER